MPGTHKTVHPTLTRVTPRACRFAPARVAPRASVGDLGRSGKSFLEFFVKLTHPLIMSTAERILQELSYLRPEKQTEVLEFVEFLKTKEEKNEDELFMRTSLASAMRGMEDEEDLYSEADILERTE